jgi:hypothetical protein
MTPEPRIVESIAIRRERRADEAKAAWVEHVAHQAHVEQNMLRLRALRLARETDAAAVVVLPVRKRRAPVGTKAGSRQDRPASRLPEGVGASRPPNE